MFFHSDISPESTVIPFINEFFSVNCRTDYENKYIKLDQNHGEIANNVEAILVSYKDNQFPISADNTAFYFYKLNSPDPELEMIEVKSAEYYNIVICNSKYTNSSIFIRCFLNFPTC